MMKLAELCVGNYVMVDGEVHMITSIYGEKKAVSLAGGEFLTYVNELEPIHLSKELLEENGFKIDERTKELIGKDYWYSKDHRIEITQTSNTAGKEWYVHIDNECFETVGGLDVEYVHELQNFFTQCGYEVKFVLKEDVK